MIRPTSTSRLRFFCLALLATSTTTIARAQTETDSVSLTEATLRSPAVASVLERTRDTPAEQLSAVFTLLDLGETDVARKLWNDFQGDDLEDETKAALVRELGTGRFLNLARREAADGLNGARSFAEGCLQAAATVGRDPQKLAQLIDDLRSESAEVRGAARSDLAITGDAGATVCLAALAQAATGEADQQLRTELLLTLARMRPGVEPMLVAALADGQGQFRRDVAELTGYLQLQSAVPWLAAIASGADDDPKVVSAAYAALVKMGLSSPRSSDARATVLSEIRRLENHENPQAWSATVSWWSYDAKQKQLSAREVSADDNQLLKIARLSRMLCQLPGATSSDQRLALIYAYQVSQLLDQPLPSEFEQRAKSLETDELSETLHHALQAHQITAAIASTQLLGEQVSASALRSVGSRRSPLAAALAYPHRELRFAALEAIMKIKPQQSFAGASEMPKALWYFAAGAGDPQVIVASPVATRASDWAGQLRGLGYDAMPVTTGRQTLLAALNSPRLEMILVDSDIGRPLLREVVYGLRSNPQLSQMPIGVLSSLHNLSRAERIADNDAWLIATPRPHTDESVKAVLDELASLGGPPITSERRTEQAAAALGWIADLLENGHPYHELLRDSQLVSQTLYNADLTAATLRLLTVLGTAESQQLLLDMASSPTQPITTRREAGAAFKKSVQQFGKLLTSLEILRQYDRYNASESADAETQQVLGAILDILENKPDTLEK